MLISKREGVGNNHYKDSETFIQYSYDMDEIYENIGEYNPNKERKILTAFYDMVAQKVSANSKRIIYELSIIICSTKKYWTKFCTLFYYEKSKKQELQ